MDTKAQSAQPKNKRSPRQKKARQLRSNVKVMLTVNHEFLPRAQAINSFSNLEDARRLLVSFRRKRCGVSRNGE